SGADPVLLAERETSCEPAPWHNPLAHPSCAATPEPRIAREKPCGTPRARGNRMRKRRAAVVLVLACVAACSTESSDDALNPQPLPPEEEGTRAPNAGAAVGDSCQGTCCEKPAEGSACDVT